MKSLSGSLEISPNVLFLTWVIWVAWGEFMQLVYITKGGSKCSGNLRISLITVSHMASCNLQILVGLPKLPNASDTFGLIFRLLESLEISPNVSLELGNSGNPRRVQTNSLFDKSDLKVVGI